jgi:hypothetical protein
MAFRTGALTFVVVGAGVLAVALHRSGHGQGDDFALYLRQARSIFDGDVAAVVADNRFAVVSSELRFSPNAYPWGWPLLLSPFVWLWGLDYDRLKLVEVGALCVWLVLLHGIVRRRIGWPAALAVVAVIATAPQFLDHTDQLLSEFPYLMTVAIVIWWYDRVREHGDLLGAGRTELIVLGALAAAAFEVRREGIVLVGVIAAAQLYDLLRRDGGILDRLRGWWRPLLCPHASFLATAALAHLLLPTALVPDNGNSPGNVDDRLREFPGILTTQLELGERPWVGVAIVAVAGAGAVVGVLRRPALDIPVIVLAFLTALAIGTHFRQITRYWLQVTPWVVYFVAAALVALVPVLSRARSLVAHLAALAPLLLMVVAHLRVLPGEISDARDFDARGGVQWGPGHPDVQPVFAAVERHTRVDDVVVYYRARTMTLVTDRRSFQTDELDRVAQRADYFAQRRNSSYSQPELDPATARAEGWEEVWSDERWILWRVPSPSTPR